MLLQNNEKVQTASKPLFLMMQSKPTFPTAIFITAVIPNSSPTIYLHSTILYLSGLTHLVQFIKRRTCGLEPLMYRQTARLQLGN